MEKSKYIEKLFQHIVIYSYLFLPLLFLLGKHKKRDSKIIALYGIVFFLLLFFFYDIPRDYRKLYNYLFTFLEYIFFASLYFNNIINKKIKVFIIALSLLFVLFQVFHYTKTDNYRIDSIPIGVESILIFVYIFLFFLETLNQPNQGFIYLNHCFWVSVGILVYLGGSFFINILANTLSREEFDKYWYLNYVADTIKTLLFAVALILLAKKPNEKMTKTKIPFLDFT